MASRFNFLPDVAELPSSNAPTKTTLNERPVLQFPRGSPTDRHCYWTAIAPQNMSGTLTAAVYHMCGQASGNVAMQIAIEAVTPDDALDLDATTSFDTDNNAVDSAPATAGYMKAQLVTLTNKDGIAPGDLFRLRLRRDADNASDTLNGDWYVLAVELRDAA